MNKNCYRYYLTLVLTIVSIVFHHSAILLADAKDDVISSMIQCSLR